MKKICVFCGASAGLNPDFHQSASDLGKYLAENELELIYGGSDLGLMGVLANAVRNAGGKVTAVMPLDLKELIGHEYEAELIVVNTLQQRKQQMFDLADAFIALPGGFGTLDEIFEMLTWSQLGYHVKPCGFLNVSGYFNDLLNFLDYSQSQGFVKPEDRRLALAADNIPVLVARLGKAAV